MKEEEVSSSASASATAEAKKSPQALPPPEGLSSSTTAHSDPPSAAAEEPPPSSSSSSLPSSKEDWEVQRDDFKQQGDQAFRMGGFKTAIGHYTEAISLDPDFVVAYSNRSAAYLKNSEKSKALRDAEQMTQLDPTYAKGYSRLAAALHSLKRWEQAQQAYQKVLELDAGNAVATKGVADCQVELDRIRDQQSQFDDEEARMVEAEKKKRHEEEASAAAAAAAAGEQQQSSEPTAKEEADEDDEDDLLNDFFEDVEQVTQKPKEEDVVDPAAVPTNKVKNEKVSLGTGKEQLERLLQTNHEWRNLNPFYVLQLPHTATEDDISRRYKALSLMLHPDKNGGDPRAQLAFDEVKKAKTVLLGDSGRAKHSRMLIEEGLKQGEATFKKQVRGGGGSSNKTLEELQEIEVMRIFAQVEQKRREVEDRERKFEQRTQQQEDALEAKGRQERQFDKSWRKEDRVHKRVGNWRDFASGGGKKKKSIT